MILYLNNFFDKDEQKVLLDTALSYDSWSPRDNDYHEHVDLDDWEDFVKTFRYVLSLNNKNELLEHLVRESFPDRLVEGLWGMQAGLMRYPTGKGLTLHKDSYSKNTTFSSFLSFIIYLNKDYKGGSFFYLDEDGQEVDIEVGSGDIIVVDPEFPHGARQVTGGLKYLATCHVETPIL